MSAVQPTAAHNALPPHTPTATHTPTPPLTISHPPSPSPLPPDTLHHHSTVNSSHPHLIPPYPLIHSNSATIHSSGPPFQLPLAVPASPVSTTRYASPVSATRYASHALRRSVVPRTAGTGLVRSVSALLLPSSLDSMLWLDDLTSDEDGQRRTTPAPNSAAAAVTFPTPPQWRVAQRERRRVKRHGNGSLVTSHSAASLTSIVSDAGFIPHLPHIRPDTPGHASTASVSSSSLSRARTPSHRHKAKYSKAIATLSLRHAIDIDMDTTSGLDSSSSVSIAHRCTVDGCLACSALADPVMSSPSGMVWLSEDELIEGLTLPPPALLQPLTSFSASLNAFKPSLSISPPQPISEHVITIQESGSSQQHLQHGELTPMLSTTAESSGCQLDEESSWWQVDLSQVVVGVQGVLSVLLLGVAAYFAPLITHTTNVLPAYLLPCALFLVCVSTLSVSNTSVAATRPTRFILLSSLLSLAILSYSLSCLFSPAPVLPQPYVFETFERLSLSLRSFVSLALLFFLAAVVLFSLLLVLARLPVSDSTHRYSALPGRGKGASMRRLRSCNYLEQFYNERRAARAERQKRKLQPSAASPCDSVLTHTARSGDCSIRVQLRSSKSMPCMQTMARQ